MTKYICFINFFELLFIYEYIYFFRMSHLRDLQKLRNTRQNYQIKKNINPFDNQQMLMPNQKQMRQTNHHQNPIYIP